jgi:hypothetical protein
VGDQLTIVNQGGEVVLNGEIYDVGATEGDVLTVQADGSVAAASGGGGGGYTYEGDGSPLGVQAAAAIGDTYLDSTNGASYFATETGSGGWVLVAGAGQGTDTGIYSSPGVAQLQDGSGGVVNVSNGGAFMQAGADGLSALLRNYQLNNGVEVSNVGDNTAVGFFGATPVVQAAAPVLLSDVITILTNLGLCAS